MGKLTENTPKPMLSHRGRNLIEHKLDALPSAIQKVIIVTGYKGDVIRRHFGNSYKGLPITYVEQKELLGTANSLWQTREYVDDKFIVLMGDDIYDKEDLESLSRHDHALLAYRSDARRMGGKFILNTDGTLDTIVEDSDGSINSPLVYTGACVLSPAIFSYEPVQIPGRKEYGLPQTIALMTRKYKIHIVEATRWKQITAPEDLE